MNQNSIFAFSFDKKPDPIQWAALKNKLPSSYSLPDAKLLANLHRSRLLLTTIAVHEWLENETYVTKKEEDELLKQRKHLLPPDYVIPDVIRVKNILIK